MPESNALLARLRHHIAAQQSVPACGEAGMRGVDGGAIDAALGGGLALGGMHEVFAASRDDAGSAAGFTAMLACRLGGSIFWLRLADAQRGGVLHAPGLNEVGCDPTRLVLAVLPDPLALLRAAAEVARCPEVGVAVIELWGSPRMLDLTASRRLVIAAQGSGVTVLTLRIDAQPTPSAARTRWSVAAAPAKPLAANAPGHPTFDIELIRQQGRPSGGRWRVEWNRDLGRFDHPASLSGAAFPVPAGGPVAPERRRA